MIKKQQQQHKVGWVGKGGEIWEELEKGDEFDQNTSVHVLTHHYTVDFDFSSPRYHLRFELVSYPPRQSQDIDAKMTLEMERQSRNCRSSETSVQHFL